MRDFIIGPDPEVHMPVNLEYLEYLENYVNADEDVYIIRFNMISKDQHSWYINDAETFYETWNNIINKIKAININEQITL